MPPISVLMKPASGLCNMRCDYCFYCDEAVKRTQESYGFMTEQTLKNVIRRTMLRAEGSITYAFQGGEPTLRGLDFFQEVVAYEQQYNKAGIQVNNALQTNGYGINEDWCRFLAQHHFLVGVSIDGVQKTHDMYRHGKDGSLTFDRILRATELFDLYGVEYNILTVVHQKVAARIPEIYSFYKKRGWRYQQYIACLDPLEEKRGQNRYALKPEQYGEFLVTLFQLWYADWKSGDAPCIREFENYIGILLGYCPEACNQRGECSIQTVVEADGSVYPCDFYMLDSYRMGNLNEDRLDQIAARGRESGFVERSMKLTAECRDCAYFRLCRGGCQRNRDLNEATGLYRNYFCESYQRFFEACLPQMKEVAEAVRRGKR